MKTFSSIIIAMGFFVIAQTTAIAQEVVQFRIQVFAMNGDIAEETSLKDDVWNTNDKALHNRVVLFDKGHLRLGDDNFKLNEEGCYWNDTELPFTGGQTIRLPENKIRRIATPTLLMNKSQEATINIQANEPFEYFDKRTDGLFELKSTTIPTGLAISVLPKEEEGRLNLENLNIKLLVVGDRQHIPNVSLPVGMPIAATREYNLKMKTRYNKTYGALLRPEQGQGFVLVMFVSSPVTSEVLATIKKELGEKSYTIKRREKKDQIVYRVDSWNHEKHTEMIILANGTLIGKNEEISEESIPQTIKDSIKKAVKEFEITDAVRIFEDQKTVYWIKLETDDKKREMTLAEDGTVLDQKR